MIRKLISIPLAVAFLLLLGSSPGIADDWPQFRGPNRDGISRETGLLKEWPATGPPELWRVPLGTGFSGVSAVGQRLYTMDSNGEKEFAVGLDARNGRELWRTEVGPLFREAAGDGPRSTPTVADGWVWAIGSYGDVVALRPADGTPVWDVSLRKRFGVPMPLFGFTMMPLIVGDNLVIEIGGETDQDMIVALDKRSGDLRWQTVQDGGMANSSPIHVTWRDTEQIIFFNLAGLFSLSPTGEALWSAPFAPQVPQKVAFPIFVEPDLVFVSASYGAGGRTLRMVPAPGRARGVGVEIAWENPNMRNNVHSSVSIDGLLCGFDNATLKCLDATSGEELWAKRGGFGKGSLIWANHHLIVLSEHGRLLQVDAVHGGYQENGTVQLIEGRTWTPPSLAGGQLYVRCANELIALDLHGDENSTNQVAPRVVERTGKKVTLSEDDDLKPEQIVNRYLEVRGAAALAQVTSIRQKGRYHNNGNEFPFVSYHQRPNLYRYEIYRPGGVVSIEAYDGEVGWQDNVPMWRPGIAKIELMPLSEIPASRLALILEDEADFEGPFVNYLEKGHRVELIGPETLDNGTPVWHLQVTLASGNVQHFFLDQRSFEVAKMINYHADAMGYHSRSERTRYFTGYRRIAGILMPVAWEVEEPPTLATFEIDEVEVNVEIPRSLFSRPDRESPKARPEEGR